MLRVFFYFNFDNFKILIYGLIFKAIKYRMSITLPNTLIPYFTPCLIHYFYNSKIRCDHQKRIVDVESTSKNTSIIKIIKNKIHTINKTKPNKLLRFNYPSIIMYY